MDEYMAVRERPRPDGLQMSSHPCVVVYIPDELNHI